MGGLYFRRRDCTREIFDLLDDERDALWQVRRLISAMIVYTQVNRLVKVRDKACQANIEKSARLCCSFACYQGC